jgi:Ca2+-binding RTX toxin-like protein
MRPYSPFDHAASDFVATLVSPPTTGQTFEGSSGDDTFTGTTDDDTFNLSQGGEDTASGLDGKDAFNMGGALDAGDRINGGSGNDVVTLNGDYLGLHFDAKTMVNVETLALAAGHDYHLFSSDGTVASGKILTVDASALGASDKLIFNGAKETNGAFNLAGGDGDDKLTRGKGNDLLAGGNGGDTFDLSHGGADTVAGGAGSDEFVFGAAFTAADHVNGGAGQDDTIVLDGEYSGIHSVTFGSKTMTNVETLIVTGGHNYDLTLNEGNISAGDTLFIAAGSLRAGEVLDLNAAHETDGNVLIASGAGADFLVGSAGDDSIVGYLGSDELEGGPGNDTFVYNSVADSTGPIFDTIVDFTANADKFALGTSVVNIGATISSGSLSMSTFDSDLAAAVNSTWLLANYALLFKPDSGDLAGKTFLVIDANGNPGYQAEQDYVIQLLNPGHVGALTTSDFV